MAAGRRCGTRIAQLAIPMGWRSSAHNYRSRERVHFGDEGPAGAGGPMAFPGTRDNWLMRFRPSRRRAER